MPSYVYNTFCLFIRPPMGSSAAFTVQDAVDPGVPVSARVLAFTSFGHILRSGMAGP